MPLEKEIFDGDRVKGSLPVKHSGRLIRNILTTFILGVLFFSTIGYPVSGHSAAEMGITPDQYDKGIPVYWPYHAALMSAGFILLLYGSLVIHFGTKPERFKLHRMLQTAGAGCILAGLVVAVFMISLSAAPHVRYIHDQIGVGVILLIMVTLILGYYINRSVAKQGTRKTHRWIGWTSIALMVMNIILGISMMAMVLAQ